MYLKSLIIEDQSGIIREIFFKKGLNLIVDETVSARRSASGNNVGKTTVVRLIDFCLGGDGKNIYQDTEFKGRANTKIEKYLTDEDVVIEVLLVNDWDGDEGVTIRRNFLKGRDRILEVNGENCNKNQLDSILKEKVFDYKGERPTFRQIISRNIREREDRLTNTIRVLGGYATKEDLEALYLFWLGIPNPSAKEKEDLSNKIKEESRLQKRLEEEYNESQVHQASQIIDLEISKLEEIKDKFKEEGGYEEQIQALNSIRSEMLSCSERLSRLTMRKSLIEESRDDLENEKSKIDTENVRRMYERASKLNLDLQKTFEEVLSHHNNMVNEKVKFITSELPSLIKEIEDLTKKFRELSDKKKDLQRNVSKVKYVESLEEVGIKLNQLHERKGELDEQGRMWKKTKEKMSELSERMDKIKGGLHDLEDLIDERISIFNKEFVEFSEKLYGEKFILSKEIEDGYLDLLIASLEGNLGTGKKKGQIAAFDLAYINFCNTIGIRCLNFIVHDQIENIHDNQISSLLKDIVDGVDCQYIVPVLKDKLPEDHDWSSDEVLVLSQDDKLFKLD